MVLQSCSGKYVGECIGFYGMRIETNLRVNMLIGLCWLEVQLPSVLLTGIVQYVGTVHVYV